jgi:hypothetical protein
MQKLTISLDGNVVKDVVLTKNRTTLGRRPYNDIVIDNLAVSGEHAVVQLSGGQATIEDLNSTNGTYLNSTGIKRGTLQHNDVIEIGKYRIRYCRDAADEEAESPARSRSGDAGVTPRAAEPAPTPPVPAQRPAASGVEFSGEAVIRVLSGAAAGRQVPLVKVVTTIGKIGVCVASITKRRQGFVAAHVEGASRLLLNGSPIGPEPVLLGDQDILELAGTRMQFLHL